MFKPFLQYDKVDCGPACLASIFNYYKLKVSISELKDICGTDREGTSASGLIKALNHYHYQHKALKMHIDDLGKGIPFPAIAQVIADDTMLHYVVVLKADEKRIKISDPAKGIMSLSRTEFGKIWTGFILLIAPGEESPKGNLQEHNLTSFLRLLLSQKKAIVAIICLSILYTALGVLAAYYYKYIMDRIIPSLSLHYLLQVSLGIICLYFVQVLLGIVRSIVTIKYEQQMDLNITLGYYHHLIMLPMRFYTMRDAGDIISRFNDAASVKALISETTIGVFLNAFMAIAFAIFLCRYNYQMFLVAFLILVLYAIIVFLYTKPLTRMNREQLEQNAKVTSRFIETINGIETIKTYHNEEKQYNRVLGMYKALLKKDYKIGLVTLSENSIISLVSSIGSVLILWIGTANVIGGKITIGELITFNALLSYFISPVTSLINLHPTIQAATVSVNRIGEVLDSKCEYNPNQVEQSIEVFQKYTVKNLTFAYGSRKPVLKNVFLSIHKGQKIGFVGDSGSGKSTLAKLLVGLYNAKPGEIFFNNTDINEIYQPLLRKEVLYLPQDVFLQSGTLRENLLYDRENISDERFHCVCEMCGIDEMASSLPLGYNTLLEENGKNLSGGQKQRIAIARALLGDPKVLIMDEATSSLDNLSEKKISEAIRKLTDNLTVIIIAHRLTTVQDCDKIFVFDDGNLCEEGSHFELLQRQGKYFKLWNGIL